MSPSALAWLIPIAHLLGIASAPRAIVPDEQFLSALQLASVRGVDVRAIVPQDADSALVDYSGWFEITIGEFERRS